MILRGFSRPCYVYLPFRRKKKAEANRGDRAAAGLGSYRNIALVGLGPQRSKAKTPPNGPGPLPLALVHYSGGQTAACSHGEVLRPPLNPQPRLQRGERHRRRADRAALFHVSGLLLCNDARPAARGHPAAGRATTLRRVGLEAYEAARGQITTETIRSPRAHGPGPRSPLRDALKPGRSLVAKGDDSLYPHKARPDGPEAAIGSHVLTFRGWVELNRSNGTSANEAIEQGRPLLDEDAPSLLRP